MKKVLLFAGTEEGRRIAAFLASHGLYAQVCVATEYGERLLREMLPENGKGLEIVSGRLDEEQIKELLQRDCDTMVIDATHPYARAVTQNCTEACLKCGIPYYRVVRQSYDESMKGMDGDIHIVESVEEAVAMLQDTGGNILVTTGSKEMEGFLALTNHRERVYYRVLSTVSVLEKCRDLGIEGRHVFAMQGPFGEELNYAMLKEIRASYLVTKESGKSGGFEEKIAAANRAGVTTIVIGRPEKETGYSCEEMIGLLEKHYGIRRKSCLPEKGTAPESAIDATMPLTGAHILSGEPQITLVGIGTGCVDNLTREGERAIREADILCGARRMLESVKGLYGEAVDTYEGYGAEELMAYLQNHENYRNIVVLYSGDIGFFSGAKKLLQRIKEGSAYEYRCIPGIASPVYFMAKLGIPWEEVSMTSLHGREENLIGKVKQCRSVAVLLGGEQSLRKLCALLLENHLKEVKLTVGERLSYEDERIRTGLPEALIQETCDSLSVVYIENPRADRYIVTHGIPDDAFLREKIPMTKMEVRSVSLSKLQLTRHAICYDIGAGSGSISVEMAQQAVEGKVYAVEKEESACALMERNQKKFGMTNMTILRGSALEVMDTLPTPTHAFIGGSGGEMEEILKALYRKNPQIRVVLNVITLDTLTQVISYVKSRPELQTEYVQMTVARSKETGNYQMMMGQNPVYIVTIQGCV